MQDPVLGAVQGAVFDSSLYILLINDLASTTSIQITFKSTNCNIYLLLNSRTEFPNATGYYNNS